MRKSPPESIAAHLILTARSEPKTLLGQRLRDAVTYNLAQRIAQTVNVTENGKETE